MPLPASITPVWNAMFIYLALLLTIDSYVMRAQIIPTDRAIKMLALGDSYTIGESVAEHQRWPLQLMFAMRERKYVFDEPVTIATTGWKTDELMRAITVQKPARDFDLVSLLIGVNNQYQGKSIAQYKSEFSELLDVAIAHAGGDKSRVFVLSIPDYGFTPFGEQKQKSISKEIDKFNEVNRNITKKYDVTYIDITDLSRRGLEDPELVANDGLHPSGKMYTLWVERILQHLVR